MLAPPDALRAAALSAFAAALLAGCGRAASPPAIAAPSSPHIERSAIAPATLRVIRAQDGRELTTAELELELSTARAVCVGEAHPDSDHHAAQLRVLELVERRARAEGAELGLGMEMIQTPFQLALDDYAAGRIDEATMLARVEWGERWGYEFSLYRPLVRFAAERGAHLLALNAPRELTRKVARAGLDALVPEERAALPELDLDDAAHRTYFERATQGHPPHGAAAPGGHGHHGADAGDFYAAQVIWDETMADVASRWLLEPGRGARRVVVLAGHAHCHARAVPARMQRRGVERVVSIRPVVSTRERVADVLARWQGDYLIVLGAAQ